MYTRKFRREKARERAREFVSKFVESKQVTPVEARLVEVLGGKTMRVESLAGHKLDQPVTLILRRPKILKKEHFSRTGDSVILYSNDLKMCLALKGYEYRRDVIGSWERDEKLKADGWRIQYIDIEWLANNPAKVQDTIKQFIYA